MAEYKKLPEFTESELREFDSLMAEQVYYLDRKSELEAELESVNKDLIDFKSRYEEFLKTVEITSVDKDK